MSKIWRFFNKYLLDTIVIFQTLTKWRSYLNSSLRKNEKKVFSSELRVSPCKESRSMIHFDSNKGEGCGDRWHFGPQSWSWSASPWFLVERPQRQHRDTNHDQFWGPQCVSVTTAYTIVAVEVHRHTLGSPDISMNRVVQRIYWPVYSLYGMEIFIFFKLRFYCKIF